LGLRVEGKGSGLRVEGTGLELRVEGKGLKKVMRFGVYEGFE
jgi:hypothetical protein